MLSSTHPPSPPSEPSAGSALPSVKYEGEHSDLRGLAGGSRVIYKTGLPFKEPTEGPHSRPTYRQLMAVAGHKINLLWDSIVLEADQYLTSRGIDVGSIIPTAVGNVGDLTPFCPLLVLVACRRKVTFDAAKLALEHIKDNILAPRGFGDVDVALREMETKRSATAANQQSVPQDALDNPRAHPDFDVFKPFTAALGLQIAALDSPSHQGTGGIFYSRVKPGTDDQVEHMVVTASHVVRPPVIKGYRNIMLTEESDEKVDVISLGEKAFPSATQAIKDRAQSWEDQVQGAGKAITKAESRVAEGQVDPQRAEANIQRHAKQGTYAQARRDELVAFAKNLTGDEKESRVIGRLIHADPISAPMHANGYPGHTIDWAAVKLVDSFVQPNRFLGSTLYIADTLTHENFHALLPCPHKVKEGEVCDRCLPCPVEGYFPVNGLVTELELKDIINGAEKMKFRAGARYPVLKNGHATGTTAGEISELKSLVRYDDEDGFQFKALEVTVMGAAGRAFSAAGDSGSAVVDREGRLIGLLTGGSGVSDVFDVSYITPFHIIHKRIEEVLPGWNLCASLYP